MKLPARFIIQNLLTLSFLTLVWIVYNENTRIPTLVSGVGFAVLALVLTNIFVLKGDYRSTYSVRFSTLFKYIPVLFIQIFSSGFDAIYRVFAHKINVGVVDITTELPTQFQRSLLSTAITLTPGTVTLEQDGKDMTIIWLDCASTDSSEAGEMIKGSFERILSGKAKKTKNPEGSKQTTPARTGEE